MTWPHLNLNLKSASLQPQAQISLTSTSTSNQPQLQSQLNLNSIWLWHKINPILLYIRNYFIRNFFIGHPVPCFTGKKDILPEPVIIFFSSGLMLLRRRLLQTVMILWAPVTQKLFTYSACAIRFCNEKCFCVLLTEDIVS